MNDPIIEGIREARHQVSQENMQNDSEKVVVAYCIELHKRYSQRLLESFQIEEKTQKQLTLKRDIYSRLE